MTAHQVEETLSKLKTNPAVVTELYPLLSKESFLAFVRQGTGQKLETAEFLTYASTGCNELPLFTSEKYPLYAQLREQPGAEVITVDGASLFKRLQDIVETGKIEVAINPGWECGIRINRSILLSIISITKL